MESRWDAFLLTVFVENKVWEVLIVRNVTCDKDQIMRERSGRNYEIKCSLLGAFPLLPECFSQPGASLRHGAREWQDWYCCNEGCELCRCCFRLLAPQHSLIDFHICDDADGDALLCELLNELHRFGFLGKEVDYPI